VGDEDEEEETPQVKPATKKEAEVQKPLAAAETRKPGERIWSTNDEVRILEALAAHQDSTTPSRSLMSSSQSLPGSSTTLTTAARISIPRSEA
jgi:hypothetical protein